MKGRFTLYRRLVCLLVVLPAAACLLEAAAQNTRQGYAVVDSLVYRPSSSVDSTLAGKSIFSVLPSKGAGKGEVKVHQSQAIARAMESHVAANRNKNLSGYRVRIYFDNSQDARGASESAMGRFMALHPGIAAYRSFQNPFFRVTVGDFRTKSEAMRLLRSIKGEFPSAFVVQERINYPAVDRVHSYQVDTVKVLRKTETR